MEPTITGVALMLALSAGDADVQDARVFSLHRSTSECTQTAAAMNASEFPLLAQVPPDGTIATLHHPYFFCITVTALPGEPT